MKIEINIPELLEKFREKYGYIYDRRDNVPGYRELVDAGDDFIKKHIDLVRAFCQYRQDCISSDREAAAFYMAVQELIDEATFLPVN